MTLEIGRVNVEVGVRVLVSCQFCGIPYGVSPRTFRGMNQERRLPTCRTCRTHRSIVVTPAMRAWWLERYTIQQMIEMAEEMWGAREKW